jgi:hypothetical protein
MDVIAGIEDILKWLKIYVDELGLFRKQPLLSYKLAT